MQSMERNGFSSQNGYPAFYNNKINFIHLPLTTNLSKLFIVFILTLNSWEAWDIAHFYIMILLVI